MLKKVLVISLLLTGWGLSAQLETSADFRRQVFDREYSFGIIGHTRGFAVNTRLLKFVDGFTKEGIEIDLVKLRHPKEVKTPNLGQARSSRGYVFNRVNSLFTIRTGYHYQKILFDKTDQGTVAITLVTIVVV
ncbi:MAG: hypothetical protein U5L96_05355 [Owenweeksia sp.]|nr:hypothetical protein [Owenweeksia sp.]